MSGGELTPYDDSKYLYVVEILDRGCKIGITNRPQARISQHRRDALAYGRQTGRVWISHPHLDARRHESQLKQWAGAEREYLSQGFDEVVAQAKKLAIISEEAVWNASRSLTDYFCSMLIR